MTAAALAAAPALEEGLRLRARISERYFDAHAARIARICHAMAERFARGGRLIAFGESAADHSDVRHVAVEFVHPVIVGKRALPALGVQAADVALLARPDDIVIAFGRGTGVRAAVGAARGKGCLSLAFAPVGAEHELPVPSDDPFVRQEIAETVYHVLWEHVHVFFEHRGLLEGRHRRTRHDSGASSFLYPFLAEAETDLDRVLADVEASVRAKAAETTALREQTLDGSARAIVAAGAGLRAAFGAGGALLACGNGGSATDAMDLVADLRHPPAGTRGRALPALDLTEDPAILTAMANDVGFENVFERQVIAHARDGDVVLVISTSGGSPNVLRALSQARRRGLETIALVGYDGGRILAEALADHIIVTPSQHIPRIQEAQATALHALVALAQP